MTTPGEKDEHDDGEIAMMPGIIAGERPDPSEFPFFVQAERDGCGATLVATDVVMTAAHCLGAFGGRVLVGAYRRGSDAEGGAEWRDVTSPMQVHPLYVPDDALGNKGYDVMLFKIAPTNNVTPVELNADPNIPVAGTNLTVAGFGYYRNDVAGLRPRYLQKATVQSLSNDVCNTLWEYSSNRAAAFDPNLMTCTMGITPDGSAKGPCSGDSGGPLLDLTGKQVGIVSWGAPVPFCSVPVAPGVYTRISTVLDWIHETICRLTDDAAGLSFGCPNFVCPADAVVFGLSNLEVPNAAGLARSYNGFVAVSITQQPAAGSPLRYGQDTIVNVTATDSGGNSLMCRWMVSVPYQDVMGAVAVQIKKGRSSSRHAIFMNFLSPGVVQEFSGFVDVGSLDGGPGMPDGVVRGRLRSGVNVTTPDLTMKGTSANDEGRTLVLRRPIPFTYRSNLRVLVTARDLPRTVVVVYFVYGQQQQ